MAALDSYSMFICFKNWNMRFDAQILLHSTGIKVCLWQLHGIPPRPTSKKDHLFAAPKKSSKRWNRGNYGENIIYNILEIT